MIHIHMHTRARAHTHTHTVSCPPARIKVAVGRNTGKVCAGWNACDHAGGIRNALAWLLPRIVGLQQKPAS